MLLFTFPEQADDYIVEIKSGAALPYILTYFRELGIDIDEACQPSCNATDVPANPDEAIPQKKFLFGYEGCTICVIAGKNQISNSFSLPMNRVIISGERICCDDFAKNFRLKFLSAGG